MIWIGVVFVFSVFVVKCIGMYVDGWFVICLFEEFLMVKGGIDWVVKVVGRVLEDIGFEVGVVVVG